MSHKTLSKYVEDTATEEMTKIDWYEIGGRGEGTFATLKSSERALL